MGNSDHGTTYQIQLNRLSRKAKGLEGQVRAPRRCYTRGHDITKLLHGWVILVMIDAGLIHSTFL